MRAAGRRDQTFVWVPVVDELPIQKDLDFFFAFEKRTVKRMV